MVGKKRTVEEQSAPVMYYRRLGLLSTHRAPIQNYSTILSGTGAHGECATFDVWVEAFGVELLFLFCFSK
jgi:hypothetical protein